MIPRPPGRAPRSEPPGVEGDTVATASRARATARLRPYLLLIAAGLIAALVMALSMTTTFSVFTATVANSGNTAASATYFTCTAATTAPSTEYLTWPLDDATVSSGSTARDAGGSQTGKYGTTFAKTTDRPCPRDTGTNRTTAVTLTSSTTSYVTTTSTTAVTAPSAYSVAIWFKTTTTAGGRMIGFSASQTGTSTGSRDRHVYMNPNGSLTFGATLVSGGNSTNGTLTATGPYNDGAWHLVVATFSSPSAVVYVDGRSVSSGSIPSGYTPQSYSGFWRMGYDSLSGWVTTSGTNTYQWAGTAAWASVYTGALTAQQVADLYNAGAS